MKVLIFLYLKNTTQETRTEAVDVSTKIYTPIHAQVDIACWLTFQLNVQLYFETKDSCIVKINRIINLEQTKTIFTPYFPESEMHDAAVSVGQTPLK